MSEPLPELVARLRPIVERVRKAQSNESVFHADTELADLAAYGEELNPATVLRLLDAIEAQTKAAPAADVVERVQEMLRWSYTPWEESGKKEPLETFQAKALAAAGLLCPEPVSSAEVALPEVHVCRMLESSGKVTWYLQLRRAGTNFINDSMDVYSSVIEGRVRYFAAQYEHLFGRGPFPRITDFDDTLPDDQKKFLPRQADTSALEKRMAELEAAAKPFADFADKRPFGAGDLVIPQDVELTMKHLRALQDTYHAAPEGQKP